MGEDGCLTWDRVEGRQALRYLAAGNIPSGGKSSRRVSCMLLAPGWLSLAVKHAPGRPDR